MRLGVANSNGADTARPCVIPVSELFNAPVPYLDPKIGCKQRLFQSDYYGRSGTADAVPLTALVGDPMEILLTTSVYFNRSFYLLSNQDSLVQPYSWYQMRPTFEYVAFWNEHKKAMRSIFESRLFAWSIFRQTQIQHMADMSDYRRIYNDPARGNQTDTRWSYLPLYQWRHPDAVWPFTARAIHSKWLHLSLYTDESKLKAQNLAVLSPAFEALALILAAATCFVWEHIIVQLQRLCIRVTTTV